MPSPKKNLSSKVKAFGVEHELEIKTAVMGKMWAFYKESPAGSFLSKWDKGSKEHGQMTEKKAMETDWNHQMQNEFIDAFWYEALLQFKNAENTQE